MTYNIIVNHKMIMKKLKIGLLGKILIAIVLGVCSGLWRQLGL